MVRCLTLHIAVFTGILALGCSSGGPLTGSDAGGVPNVGGRTSAANGGLSAGGNNPSGGQSANVQAGSGQSSSTTASGGGTSTSGTNTTGGITTGGSPNTGGSAASGAAATGGTTSNGGSSAKGGTPNASGGTVTAGGTKANGGASATGGVSSSGGVSSTGGTGTAGSSASCPFPTSFKWADSGGPLATPQNGWNSLKDFTSVVYNNQHIVYSSMYGSGAYGSAMMTFSDWPAATAATQTKLTTSTVAPTLFYFTPKSLWILAYQWCSAKFCYATSTDATKPTSWAFGKVLLNENITGASATGPIDQTVICDSTNCYLFYADDNGHIYRASMPIGNFPGTFSGSTSIISESSSLVFEAVQVYAVKGTGQYLMIIETNSSPRYFRAYSASSLGGAFTAIPGASTQATPFAGKSNVTFTGTAWTSDISHGDLVRTNPDETQTVDPCNMQFLYQGRDPNVSTSYDERPYRPGLLTKTN